MHRRPETWLLLSTKPVDLTRLWSVGGGIAAVKTACIIYNPARQPTTAPASQRIATTAVELAEMIAATAADRVLCVEDAHLTDHDNNQQASPCCLSIRRIGPFFVWCDVTCHDAMSLGHVLECRTLIMQAISGSAIFISVYNLLLTAEQWFDYDQTHCELLI